MDVLIFKHAHIQAQNMRILNTNACKTTHNPNALYFRFKISSPWVFDCVQFTK